MNDPTKPYVKAKNLRVPNPDYDARKARLHRRFTWGATITVFAWTFITQDAFRHYLFHH